MTNKRSDFRKIENFSLFYGIGNSKNLSKSDLTIVEPQGQNEITINEMHSTGTLVIAYVSVIEIFEAYPYYKLLKDEDFLKINNKRVRHLGFNTYLVNLKSKRWISILMQHIGNLILSKNYDGLFLDTIGDVEFSVFNEQMRDELICGAVELITKIRELYKDIIIIQNNGLNKLIDNTFKFIDGVCWENPRFWDNNNADWFEYIISKLSTINKEENIVILLLYEKKGFTAKDFNKIHYAEKVAKTKDFLIYLADSYC